MTHIPYIVLGMVFSPFLGWCWLAVSDWRNERRWSRDRQRWYGRNG